MKVHGFQRSTVGLCLGLAQNGKDAHGRGAGAVGQIGFVQDVQHLGQPAVYVVMVAVSVFVDMFMVVAMFSLVVVAAMPMAVRMSILVMMVVVLVMVMLMHIVGVAALLHPAVQVGHIVVVVLVLGVQYHVKIAGVQPGLFHSADVDAEPIQRQAGQRFAQHSLVRAQVQQRRRDHIAADAGVTFQIQGVLFFVHTLILFRAQGQAVDLGGQIPGAVAIIDVDGGNAVGAGVDHRQQCG